MLEVLALKPLLTAIIGRDKVENAKPAPDAYLAAVAAVGVPAASCLVLEDSLNGVRSAVAAGVAVVAVANEFTEADLRSQTVLDQRWCVYESRQLRAVVEARCLAMPTA